MVESRADADAGDRRGDRRRRRVPRQGRSVRLDSAGRVGGLRRAERESARRHPQHAADQEHLDCGRPRNCDRQRTLPSTQSAGSTPPWPRTDMCRRIGGDREQSVRRRATLEQRGVFCGAAGSGADAAARLPGARTRARHRRAARQRRNQPLRTECLQGRGRDSSPSPRSSTAATSARGDTLVCASEGNHGRAVARAAREAGCAARVYLLGSRRAAARRPRFRCEGATIVTVRGTLRRCGAGDGARCGGARLDRDLGHVVARLRRHPAADHARLHAADGRSRGRVAPARAGRDLRAGGVGGLLAAVACWADWRYGDATVRASSASSRRRRRACRSSVQAGRPTSSTGPFDTVMGGLRCGEVSPVAFAAFSTLVDAYVAIEDDWAFEAIRALAASGGRRPGDCWRAPRRRGPRRASGDAARRQATSADRCEAQLSGLGTVDRRRLECSVDAKASPTSTSQPDCALFARAEHPASHKRTLGPFRDGTFGP